MYYLSLAWSLLPIPIGIGCLIFAWGILYKRNKVDPDEDAMNRNVHSDKELEDFFSQAPKIDIYEEKELNKNRKSYYIIIFTGLGIGSILLGLTTFFPHLMLGAKGAFAFTIFISFAMHSIDQKKAREKNIADDT